MFTMIAKDQTDFDPHRFKIKVNETWVHVPPRTFPVAVLIINHPGINLLELCKMMPNSPEQSIRSSVSEIRSAFLEAGAHVEMGYFIRTRRRVSRPVTQSERDNYEMQIEELKSALNKGANVQHWPGMGRGRHSGLSARQSAALSLLYTHEAVTDKALIAVMPARDSTEGRDDVGLLRIEISYLRKALQPLGIEIERVRMQSYFINKKGKAILAALLRGDKESEQVIPEPPPVSTGHRVRIRSDIERWNHDKGHGLA